MPRLKRGMTIRGNDGLRRVSWRFLEAPSPYVLPLPIVDSILVSSARHRHVPLDGPVIGVVEALPGVGLRRGVKEAPRLKLVGFQEAAGLGDEIVDEWRRVPLDQLDGSRLC